MEPPNLASYEQPALRVCFNEINASLEKGVSVASPSNIEKVGTGAPSRVVATPAPQPKSTPPTDTMAPAIEDVVKLIRRWNPFNEEDSPIVHMRDLYPNYFRIPVAARSK